MSQQGPSQPSGQSPKDHGDGSGGGGGGGDGGGGGSILRRMVTWRGGITVHLHLGILLSAQLVYNMPFALVCMLRTPATSLSQVFPHESSEVNGTSAVPTAESAEFLQRNSTTEASRGEFDWDSSTQGVLLSSSLMLMFVSPLLTDVFIRAVGSKRLMLWTTICMAGLSLLQPLAARLSVYLMVALRLAMGLMGGVRLPLVMEVISWWAPNSEKVTMLSVAYAASSTSFIAVSLLSGFLCSVPVDNGWPFIFYVQGSLAVLWAIVWQLTASDKPENHPYISEDEKEYIIRTRHAMDKSQKRGSPPYRKILSCVPMWGSLIMQATHFYCNIVMASYTPLLLTTVHGFTLQQVGLITAMMYVTRFLSVGFWGQVSNMLLQKARLHTTTCRKVIQCCNYYLSVVSLVALGYVRQQTAVLCLLFLVMVLQSATVAAACVLPLDIAPRYSAFLNGLVVTAAMLACMPSPLITSAMLQHGSDEEWRNVFISLAAVAFFGATCFLVMGSATLQSWARPEGQNKIETGRSGNKGKESTINTASQPTSATLTLEHRRSNILTTIMDNDVTPSSASQDIPMATITLDTTCSHQGHNLDLAGQSSIASARTLRDTRAVGSPRGGEAMEPLRVLAEERNSCGVCTGGDRGMTNLGFDSESKASY